MQITDPDGCGFPYLYTLLVMNCLPQPCTMYEDDRIEVWRGLGQPV